MKTAIKTPPSYFMNYLINNNTSKLNLRMLNLIRGEGRMKAYPSGT